MSGKHPPKLPKLSRRQRKLVAFPTYRTNELSFDLMEWIKASPSLRSLVFPFVGLSYHFESDILFGKSLKCTPWYDDTLSHGSVWTPAKSEIRARYGIDAHQVLLVAVLHKHWDERDPSKPPTDHIISVFAARDGSAAPWIAYMLDPNHKSSPMSAQNQRSVIRQLTTQLPDVFHEGRFRLVQGICLNCIAPVGRDLTERYGDRGLCYMSPCVEMTLFMRVSEQVLGDSQSSTGMSLMSAYANVAQESDNEEKHHLLRLLSVRDHPLDGSEEHGGQNHIVRLLSTCRRKIFSPLTRQRNNLREVLTKISKHSGAKLSFRSA